MNKYEKGLIEARDSGIITEEQRAQILTLCAEERPWLQIACYSLGGVLLLGAIFFLMSGYWRLLHGMALVVLAFIASALFCAAGVKLLRRGERVAGGIFALAGLCLIPVAMHNLWNYAVAAGWLIEMPKGSDALRRLGAFNQRDLAMELTSIAGSLFVYSLTGEGLTLLPSCGALWFLFMTLAPPFMPVEFLSLDLPIVSALAGVFLILAGALVRKQAEDDSLVDARSLLLSAGAGYLWLSALIEFPFDSVPPAANCAVLSVLSLVCIVLGAKFSKFFISLLGSMSALYAVWYTFDTYYRGSNALPWFLFAAGSLILAAGIWRGKRKR